MVHSPYTAFFTDAFMAAHVGIGVLLAAIVVGAIRRDWLARTLFLIAIALAVVAPLLGDFVHGFGAKTPPMRVETLALVTSTIVVAFAVFSMRRFAIGIAACVVAVVLAKIPDWVPDSTAEICALHSIWIGIALGLVQRREGEPTKAIATPLHDTAHDLLIFAGATFVAVLASIFVLERADGSADEWAYTWQAATFAKGHVYAQVPPCESAFQNFYVFESMGRLFGQYTPGWPLFIMPFVVFRVPWLAGPAAHGLLAVGVARVARSAIRLDGRGSKTRERAAGLIAAFAATFGTTILIVGASRYSHTIVAAAFAWALECTLVLQARNGSTRSRVTAGVLLGSAVAMMGASRPADGATLSVGLALYFLYALVRRRIEARAFLATLGAFAFWSALTLIILRVQLGRWFVTGYSLNAIIHPWNVAKYGWPRASEIKFALPLATGSYAWFPCSLAIGLAGILSLRRRATGIAFVLLVSLVTFDVYYQFIDYARGYDWGYGPRYETPFVVLMATGAGIAFAALAESARRHTHARAALYAGGPFLVVVVTVVMTLVRLWPLLYPGIYAHVHQHDSLNARIRELEIHHAIVIAQVGTTGFDALDLTENLPIDLYPNQDVLIATERRPEAAQCVRRQFPDRKFYRASGNPVVITPL